MAKRITSGKREREKIKQPKRLDKQRKREDRQSSGSRNFEEMRQRLKDNAEEKLSGEREHKALISNIAHDVLTPITAVKGYAE